jgi:glycosidase
MVDIYQPEPAEPGRTCPSVGKRYESDPDPYGRRWTYAANNAGPANERDRGVDVTTDRSFEQVIWWQVYPLGFGGAPIREAHTPGHRLRRLLGWLDEVVELGCTGLLLGPICASATHGYDSVDLRRIDPRLGTEHDFDDLVAGCRSRGLRLLLDGVFSHVGRDHPLVAQALAEGPDSAAAALFDIDWSDPADPHPRVFEGHDTLVRLNHAGDAAADWVTDVLIHWLDRGADGWRLDAAYSVPPPFWARVLAATREKHPDAWFLGEVIHGDYPDFVTRSTVDSVTQYELWKAIWSSLKDGNFFELDWTLQRHNDFLGHFRPNTFIGNHDVTRIADQVGPTLVPVALTILLTVGGIPSIYYGDERGFTGIKQDRLGGDDAVRPEYPDSPADLPRNDLWRMHAGLIDVRRSRPWLAGASTESLELTNTRYRYRASGDGEHLDVELDLDRPSVLIRDAGGGTIWEHAG